MMANTILRGPPSSSYINQLISCPSCHGLDMTQKQSESTPVCVQYSWGGSYWYWTRTVGDIRASDAQGCQICGVLCDLLVELKKTDDCGNINVSDTITFLLPLGTEGSFHVKFPWRSRGKNGNLEVSSQVFQIGTSSICELLPKLSAVEKLKSSSLQGSTLPFERLREGGHISRWPHSGDTVSKVSGWLHDCVRNHLVGNCHPSNQPTEMPRSLIRIGDTPNESVLIETGGEMIPYVALSHCWAYGKVLKPTRSTQWEKGIPESLLSDTFRTAMFFTSKLGFVHIRIDSLCIVQDDAHDWIVEASPMGLIYREAVLVISVVAEVKPWFAWRGNGSSQGVFQPRQPTYQLRNKHRKYQSEPETFLVHKPITHMSLENNPSEEERGWTLQERLMAKRIVHFTPVDLVWKFKSESHCECRFLDNQMDHSFKTTYDTMLQSNPTVDTLIESWRHLVRLYTDRELTKDSDRLPAISSLARQHGSPELGAYLAGSWRNYLLEMISWFRDDGSASGHRRPTCYVAPSWSWASLVGSIDWNWSGFLPLSELSVFSTKYKE